MSDDKNKTGNPDRARINLSEDYEVRDWAEKFGVTEDELREAVQQSGSNSAVVVEEYLSNR